ncbi:MAG: TonB-dependent receptor domain-containing protein [Terriglobales bacterium]|jgi:Carboxypeptidase regulatory-like domain/TonB dependent receptor
MSRSLLRSLPVVAILFITCLLQAQSTGGRIIGRVTDTSGAVVPGAKITLTNEATGVDYNSQSGGNGDFSVLQLPVGVYTVTVDHGSFKKYVRKGVRLELNQVLNLEVAMQLGSATEVVNVTGEAPLVDTSSTQLGTSIDAKTVTGLPLGGRDTYQLLQIQPGVTSTGGADLFYGSDTAGAVSVNGGRGRANNFNVNGGDANDLFVNAPAVQPSPDAIQEFRVITNTFDAEYGRNSGSVVNVVTKSGTNAWHGSAFEFFRNSGLNAKGYFDPYTPALIGNQFGGTFGGPIKKDKTFFFLSYEGRRTMQGFTSDPANVPTAAERAGDFSQTPFDPTAVITDANIATMLTNRGCGAAPGDAWTTVFPTSQVPLNCLDPVAVDLLNFVPCPNVDPHCTNLANTNHNYQAIPIGHTNDDQFTARLDHQFNTNHNLSIYYYLQTGTLDRPFSHFESFSPSVIPGFGTENDTTTQQINASHTWTINPTMVNEARFTYFRLAQGKFLHPKVTSLVTDSCPTVKAFCFTGTDDAGVVVPDPKLGITPNLGPTREGLPFISVAGGFTIGNNFEGEIPQIGNSYQWADNLTKVLGKHTMKFGVDFRNQRLDQTLFFDPNGDFGFTGGGLNDPIATDADGNQNVLPNYLLGIPDSFLQGSAQTSHYRTNSLYLYAQDSWKLKSNLTLNYGLRWELNTPFEDKLRRVQTFRPGQASTVYPCSSASCPGGTSDPNFPLGLVVPGDKGVPGGLTDTYYKSWAPRIGIAYSPGSSGKTSIRAGFGVFYNPIEQLVLEQLGAQPPFGGSTLVSEGMFQTPFELQSGGPVPNPFNGFLSPPPGTAIDWAQFRPILLFGQVPKQLKSQYTEQYNISVEREIAKDMVASVGYVGSQGHRLLATHDLNFGNAETCLDIIDTLADDTACGQYFADSSFVIPSGTVIGQRGFQLPYAPAGQPTFIPAGTTLTQDLVLVGLRPFSSPNCNPYGGAGCPTDGIPVFSSIFSQDTIAQSSYNGLQASLEKRLAHGLQFLAAYTFSKAEDTASSFEQILNPLCSRCNIAPSLFDARHRFVISYYWELPIQKFSGAKRLAFNGWAVSGITTFQSGFPIRILSQDDQELQNSFDFELPGKPDLTAPFHTQDPRTHGGYGFDPNSFTEAALGSLGSAKRTICCGPGIRNFDVSIQKDTRMNERLNMQFRAEFFNLFNTTQFLNPDGNFSDGTDFGKVKRARDPRQIQFALKFNF